MASLLLTSVVIFLSAASALESPALHSLPTNAYKQLLSTNVFPVSEPIKPFGEPVPVPGHDALPNSQALPKTPTTGESSLVHPIDGPGVPVPVKPFGEPVPVPGHDALPNSQAAPRTPITDESGPVHRFGGSDVPVPVKPFGEPILVPGHALPNS